MMTDNVQKHLSVNTMSVANLSFLSYLRVQCLCRFGLSTVIHFAHFGLESSMVFEGTTGVYERTYVSIPNE